MSNLVEFAEQELNNILKTCTDSESLKMQQLINKDILEMVKVFSEQGHSGFSAGYSLNILKRLLDYKPITPLTGEDDEWIELDYGDDIAYQNKRCPSVFKTKDGRAYNVEGKVFSDDGGHTWFNSRDSHIDITFPYEIPDKPEYVVIDNLEVRLKVLNEIVNIVKELGGEIPESYNEDTKLDTMLNKDRWNELEQEIIEKYKIKKPIFNVADVTRLWELVSITLKSDKVIDTED